MDARLEKALRKLAAAQRELSALKVELTGSGGSSSAATKGSASGAKRPSKAAAATADSDSEASGSAVEKPKRPANAWILFTQRVERAIREQEAEAGVTGSAKMKTVVVKQFASHLKGLKAYEEWDNSSIIAALSGWSAPPPKAASSAASAASAGSKATVSSASSKKTAELSEEEKEAKRQEKAAKAAATRAAKKASGGLDSLSLADLRSRYEELAGKKPAASLKKAELLSEVKRLSETTTSDDTLEHNGQTYMRVKNHLWLANDDEEMEYAGVWDPKKKTITMGPEPDVESL
jgi:hypothetical protein